MVVEDDGSALSDEPRLSSAALCIEMGHLGESFGPEFTHQCVPGEHFRGYRPSQNVINDARSDVLALEASEEDPAEDAIENVSPDKKKDVSCSEKRKSPPSKKDNRSPPGKNGSPRSSNATASKKNGSPSSLKDGSLSNSPRASESLLHPSHKHHSLADNELRVYVTLAPSCRACHVSVETKHVRSNKRRRISAKKKTKNEKVKEDLRGPRPGAEIECKLEKKLTELDISNMVQKALPISNASLSDVEQDHLLSPIGNVLAEYTVDTPEPRMEGSPGRTRSKTTERFVISLADGRDPITASYHSQVQKMAIWFIETGDEVDISADNSGFWKVLYLFRKLPSKTSSTKSYFALAGYVTLFHFYAIFHKPTPGVIVRVCQALILPPFQRQGHGKRLLQCVYDIAHGKYSRRKSPKSLDQTIVQINVEDPAPAFAAMRCKVDYEQFANMLVEWLDEDISVHDEKFFNAPTEAQLTQLSAITKITPRQMQIVFELVKLEAVHELEAATLPVKATRNVQKAMESVHKRYRLMVKRRLNKEHREDLSVLSSKEEKQTFLSERFDQEMAQYKKILTKTKN